MIGAVKKEKIQIKLKSRNEDRVPQDKDVNSFVSTRVEIMLKGLLENIGENNFGVFKMLAKIIKDIVSDMLADDEDDDVDYC